LSNAIEGVVGGIFRVKYGFRQPTFRRARGTSVLDLQTEQHDQGQPYQDLYEAVSDLKRRHDLHPCAVRPRDGLALRRDSERELVQDLVKRFRDLPADQRRRLPALLNSLAQLEVVVGDLEASQHDFQEVARLVADPISQAEAHHNVYRAALERRDWSEALAALRRAAALDPDAFEPFPLARYEPLRLLGAGGFGVTFLCQDREADRKVVVKALRADSLDRDLATVFRDLRTQQELDNPILIRIRDCACAGPEETRPYVVMEYFEGQSLAEHVAQHGALAPDEWLELCWPLARALQAAHGRGILHRSLRPASVLVRRERTADGVLWHLRLLDTGLGLKRALIHATASNPAARAQTALGRSVARLVPYQPPEVVGKPKGQVWVGPHSDVFSFGKLTAFALMARPDPDAGDRVILSDAWREALDVCTGWVIGRRPEHFGAVLERLSQLPGAQAVIDRCEQAMHEATVAEHTAALEADPENATAYVNRGNAHARQGDFDRAVADFTEALRLQPGDAGLYRKRASAHARRQATDEAIADYTESLRLEPHNVEAYANRGLAYAQKLDFDRAIADYTEGLHLHPRDEVLFYNRGNAHYCKTEYDRAIADYTQTVRIDPQHAWAYGNRGKAYALKGDLTKALADFTRVLQLEATNLRALWDRGQTYADLNQYDRALADFTAALRLEANPNLYTDRGLAHANLGDLDAAVADFTEALRLDPAHAPARMLRGNAHFDRGELEPALADLSEAVRLNPSSAAAHYNRANVLARLGRHDEASAGYTEAIRLEPDHAPAHFNRGNSHAERGDLDAAVADYTAALRLQPGDAAAHTNRGNAYSSLGDPEKALADYDESVRLDPTDAVTFFNRGNTHARMGDLDRAIADYSEAIHLDPRHARAHNARGNARADRGELDEAIADFNEAIHLDPAFARAYHNRGNARADRGELDEAVADFNEAIRLGPTYAPAYYNRGNAHSERGAFEEAVADFTEAIRLGPPSAATYNNRGNAHVRLGRTEEALADFTAALQADPHFAMAYFNRARVHWDRGEYHDAVADYTEAIRLEPGDLSGYHNRGRVRALLGDYAAALADNLEALRLAPEDALTHNNLAWLWATCPKAELRDPVRALEYGRKACELTGWREPGFLDTLAAACAANGQFEEAAQWQRKAMELCREEEKPDYQTRLALFEAGRAYVAEG
jgi:tetratricopeptide (TPR) repeat protein